MEKPTLNKKYTKTTIFLLPVLEKPFTYWRDNRLYDAFIADAARDDNKGKIYVLFDNDKSEAFNTFETNISQTPYFDESYDVSDGEYKMKVFNVPEKYLPDYYLYLKGSYSHLSNGMKGQIMRNFNANNAQMNAILYPQDENRTALMEDLGIKTLPNDEVYSTPGEDEIFKEGETIVLIEEPKLV